MYIKIITPLGTIFSMDNRDVTPEEAAAEVGKAMGKLTHMVITTESGPVILGQQILENSIIEFYPSLT